MKLLLKLILILCFVFLGTYAAAPLWLPYIFASQLPTGWQLEELHSGYPGVGGIDVDHIRIKGGTGATDIELTASGIRFDYRGLKTDIELVTANVRMYSVDKKPADSFTLEDLSLPVVDLSGKMPTLSVDEMHLVLHELNGLHDEAFRPLRLGFEDVVLTPRSGQAYQLTCRMTIARAQHVNGQLEAEISPDLLNAMMRFTNGANGTPWLTLQMEQADLQGKTTTRLKASFDSHNSNREWLDSLLAAGTGQLVIKLDGKLELEANFTGHGLQSIETLALASDKFRLITESGTLDLNADLLAKREGENIAIELPGPANILFLGKIDLIDEVLERVIPGLQLTHGADNRLSSQLGSGSRFSIGPGSEPAIGFKGDLQLSLASEVENLTLHSSGIRIGADHLNNPGSITTDGLILFTWQLNAPLTYTSNDLRFEAVELSMAGELATRDGMMVSKGSGTFRQARVTTHDVFAEELEVAWQELDLINLTGQLETHTNGLSAEIGGNAWEGFDFHIDYALSSGSDINGAGIATFSDTEEFPFEFTGNTQAQTWNIKLLRATIKLSELAKLLSAVHYQLPDSITLTDGFIELQGDVLIDDEITAELLVSGHDVGASLMESSARKAGFSFKTGFDRAPWAGGPVTIEAVTLAGGVEVAQLNAEVEIENNERYGLRNISADFFDGQLKLRSLQFSEGRLGDTTIELNHINLGSLLAYADIDGLEGSGFLDMTLPVGSDQNGFYVKGGTFSSNGPGRLAYTKEGVAGSNIGLQALENFEYKELSGTLNYQSDGNYLMTIRLDGKNPDLYDGHPVVFNLNVNGLLPEFFEAMFMTGSFEESILKQIQSR